MDFCYIYIKVEVNFIYGFLICLVVKKKFKVVYLVLFFLFYWYDDLLLNVVKCILEFFYIFLYLIENDV